jgi:hypothetical protein
MFLFNVLCGNSKPSIYSKAMLLIVFQICVSTASAQTVRVVDSLTRQGLSGVAVRVRGGVEVLVTDAVGVCVIPPGSSQDIGVRFTNPGYQTKEVKLAEAARGVEMAPTHFDLSPVVITSKSTPISKCKEMYVFWGEGVEIGRYINVPSNATDVKITFYFDYVPFASGAWKARMAVRLLSMGNEVPGEELAKPIFLEPSGEGKFQVEVSLRKLGIPIPKESMVVALSALSFTGGYVRESGDNLIFSIRPDAKSKRMKPVGLRVGKQACSPPAQGWVVGTGNKWYPYPVPEQLWVTVKYE